MPGLWTHERPATADLDEAAVARIVSETWGISGEVTHLSSYIDRNFKIDSGSQAYVFRAANEADEERWLELENRAMKRVHGIGLSGFAVPSRAGRTTESVVDRTGRAYLARLTTYVEGELLRSRAGPIGDAWDRETTRDIGRTLGRLGVALEGLADPEASRRVRWDLSVAPWIVGALPERVPAARRALVERVQLQFLADVQRVADDLPRAWIHGDGHLANLLIADRPGPARISGVIDFGDMVHAPRVFELGIAGAYLLGGEDPLEALLDLVSGYEEHVVLTEAERRVLFPAICMRLAVSFTIATLDSAEDPENRHVIEDLDNVTQALEKVLAIDPDEAAARLSGFPRPEYMDKEKVRALRARHLGRSLSISYADPLEIVRGRMQYLFDEQGRAYLDGVNNVCHVGHCHPLVVAAAQEQLATLNTNTRYLHESVVRYAERLTSLFPEPLSVAHFVSSGSEANELALRLARAFTGRRDMIVVASGYHGNTGTLVDLSDYKHAGPGGQGAPDWVHVVPCPDVIDGTEEDGVRFADHVRVAVEEARAKGREVAGMLVEPLIGCGGQIVPPPGYLRTAFEHVRAAGGVCIADEVQVGFGRVGDHWWAFERDGVVPDLVTLGKPMGNGHPLAGVVTSPVIAEAFDRGMEFFSTFGGNPVSATIGLAVLDAIEQDGLRANATRIGAQLMAGFRALAQQHEVLGDVRGAGLYLGVEFVTDRSTRAPDAATLAAVIEEARRSGVLLSSDGPQHNVMKIKPPLCWNEADARLCLAVVARALETCT